MVGQRFLDVRDAGALVLERDTEPLAIALGQDLQPRDSASTVIDGVAGELTRRRDDLRLVDERESRLDRPGANGLANRDDIGP